MGNILHPNSKLQLPNGLAERREQERLEKAIPLAMEAEKQAKEDFAVFLEAHNVFFEVHIDKRVSMQGEREISQGLTFISKLRLPEEQQVIH